MVAEAGDSVGDNPVFKDGVGCDVVFRQPVSPLKMPGFSYPGIDGGLQEKTVFVSGDMALKERQNPLDLAASCLLYTSCSIQWEAILKPGWPLRR